MTLVEQVISYPQELYAQTITLVVGTAKNNDWRQELVKVGKYTGAIANGKMIDDVLKSMIQ